MKNKVNLIGHLGNNPEIVNFEGGGKLAKFSLATSEKYTNKQGEKVEDVQWHNIVVHGKSAEVVEKYLSKGDRIDLDGKIKYRKYEKDGKTQYFTEIVVTQFLFLSIKGEAEKQVTAPANEPDDLPF